MNTYRLLQRLPNQFTRIDLLQTALTHSSYVNENQQIANDNERLEFLGDAVLDLIVGEYLFHVSPPIAEGEMTTLRASLVRAETLADMATTLGISDSLRLGNGEDANGGRKKTATLCATMEAVLGALYLDVGLAVLTDFVVEHLIEPRLAEIRQLALHRDAKSEFQVWAQAELKVTPKYVVLKESGPDHDKKFTIQVLIDETVWGEGTDSSKRTGAQRAAEDALRKVQQQHS